MAPCCCLSPQDKSLDDAVIYVDNSVESTTGSGSTGTTLDTSSSGTLTIGRDESGTYLSGLIDDVRFGNDPLPPASRQALRNRKPTAPPEPDVIRPKIILQPVHQVAATGGSATFTVEATGKPEPSTLGKDRRKESGRIYPEPLMLPLRWTVLLWLMPQTTESL